MLPLGGGRQWYLGHGASWQVHVNIPADGAALRGTGSRRRGVAIRVPGICPRGRVWDQQWKGMRMTPHPGQGDAGRLLQHLSHLQENCIW